MSTEDDLRNGDYRNRLKLSVEAAIENGAVSLEDIAAQCHGAGPEVVSEVLSSLGLNEQVRRERATHAEQRAALARARASRVQAAMPAPDPEAAQWWFSLNAIERVASLAAHVAGDGKVCFVGAPTVAAYYATRYERAVTLVDADAHALAAAVVDCSLPNTLKREGAGATPSVTPHQVDVRDDPPPGLATDFDVVVMDPPWYVREMTYFSRFARRLGRDPSYLLTTYPGPLTRPDDGKPHREKLASEYPGYVLMTRMPSYVSYRVPEFEAIVYKAITNTPSSAWRHGDVLVLMKDPEFTDGGSPGLEPWSKSDVEVYTKNPKELRLFLAPGRALGSSAKRLTHIPAYSSTVSRRGPVDLNRIGLWSSTKVGFEVGDAGLVRDALQKWMSQDSRESVSDAEADVLQIIEKHIGLPPDTRDTRRTDSEQLKREAASRSSWATAESARKSDELDDGYRLPFQRDRDRIVWSDGLRSLAGKTQVFSVESSENVRQRLAHSLEVAQLAATISAAFGLSRDLVEAGALAHDIGHTPFGHAGEHALNKVLNAIEPRFEGFNHYEHGVDVVRWLEWPYRSSAAGLRSGLNLTAAVCECIFKHTYCLGGVPIGQAELWRRSKHRDWAAIAGEAPCHLEGQAVRLADKISYLVSDLEDGIRMGALTIADLRACRLFEHAPLDYERLWGESEHERYVSQRRALLSFLMEDAIDATAKRLPKGDWRRRSGYTVNHSERVADEVSEVWHKLQVEKLHRDAPNDG